MFFSLLQRTVNDDNTQCRQEAQNVLRSLIQGDKVNQANLKTILNTSLKMGSDDESKKDIMLLAKLIGLQVFAATGIKDNSNKLNLAMIREIYSEIFNKVICQHAQQLQV